MENSVQDQVSHELWGMYAALLSFGFLFITLADLGINYYTTRTLASTPQQLKAFFPNLLTFKLVLVFVYPFTLGALGWLWGYRETELYFLMILALVHGGTQLMGFFRANIRAMQRFRLDAFLSVFERILLLGLVGLLFVAGLTIERFIYARLAAVMLTALIFYVILMRLYGWLKPRLEMPIIKQIARYSMGLAVVTMLASIHDKVDQVMLYRLAGKAENGLYAAAYRWMDAASMFLWTVLPIFYARFAFHSKDFAEQTRLLRFGQVVSAIPLIYLSVFVFFFGEKLFFQFAQSTDAELITMTACVKVLFLAMLFNAIFSVFSTLLTSTHHERFVNRVTIGVILLNIGLNAWLIPRYGAVASAATTVLSYLIMDLAFVWYIHQKLPVAVPWGQTGKLILLAGLTAGAFALWQSLGLNWLWVSGLSLGSFGGLILVLGLVDWAQIKSLRS